MRIIDFATEAPKARARLDARKAREYGNDWCMLWLWSAVMPMAFGFIWAGTAMTRMGEGMSLASKELE